MKTEANKLTKKLITLIMLAGCLYAPCVWALGDTEAQKDSVPKVEAVKDAAPSAEKKADAKCEGITLTGEKFLDMFHAIYMHGDLTDAPFIEKTLQTEFDVKYHNNQDSKNHNYKRATYSTKSILGAPIEMTLAFDVERDPKIENNFIGSIRLIANIHDCLGVTVQDIEKTFGVHFHPSHPRAFDNNDRPVIVTNNMASTRIDGKNDSTIRINFIFGGEQMRVLNLTLFQDKKQKK